MIYLLLLFVAGRCLVPMDETDLFFNLRLGEVVLTTHQVPTENLLSFTYPAARDINLAWLFQVLLALVHRWAGIPGTVVLKTTFVLAAWAVLFRVAVRRGAHPALTALVLALAAWSAEPRFVERPHLVTFLGLSLLLLGLERAEAGQPRLLYGMAPAGLLWANANSCFFLAPAILLLYAVGAATEGRRSDAGRALKVAGLMVPLMFVTPSTFHCLYYIGNHFRMPFLRPLEEYRSASWPVDGPYFILLAGVVGSLLVAIIARFGRRPGLQLIPWRVLLPTLALALLGARRIRFVAEFSMLAGPALAVVLTRLLPVLRRPWFSVASAVALLTLSLVPRARAASSGSPWFEIGMEPDLVPLAAIDFVEKHGLRERMYNDLEVGSYLTWRGWPRYRVFQDPRINGYPEAFHAMLRRADWSRGPWQELLASFDVDAALLTYPEVNPRSAWFDPKHWALVYRATDGLVFARRNPAHATLIAELELPTTFAYTAASGLQALPLSERPAASPVPSCEWQRRLGEYYRGLGDDQAASRALQAAQLAPQLAPCADPGWQAQVKRELGALALRLGDPGRAAQLLDGESEPQTRTNHGFALLALGNAAQALHDFEMVLSDSPSNDEATFGRGLALQALGRNAEAIAAFEMLLARSPHHLSAGTARSHLRALRAR